VSLLLLRRSFLVLATAWVIAIPLAAFAASREDAPQAVYTFALAVYSVGRIVCHQLPARSFHAWMTTFPVCARCAGIYFGSALTAMAMAFRSMRPGHAKTVLLIAILPTAATLVFEWTTAITPANWIRALAGLPLGAAVAWAIGMVD
jgi:uncharacterized membrane protein